MRCVCPPSPEVGSSWSWGSHTPLDLPPPAPEWGDFQTAPLGGLPGGDLHLVSLSRVQRMRGPPSEGPIQHRAPANRWAREQDDRSGCQHRGVRASGCVLTWGEGGGSPPSSVTRAPSASLPEAPHPDAITLGVRFQHGDLVGKVFRPQHCPSSKAWGPREVMV